MALAWGVSALIFVLSTVTQALATALIPSCLSHSAP